jgi:starch-binding outer membrane protein, SusD/RagB family
MDELSDERSRELCAEGWRRFDLIRWGKLFSTVTNLYTTNVNNITPNYYYWNTQAAQGVKDNFTSYKIWFPIPKAQLQTNKNLVQNFGY